MLDQDSQSVRGLNAAGEVACGTHETSACDREGNGSGDCHGQTDFTTKDIPASGADTLDERLGKACGDLRRLRGSTSRMQDAACSRAEVVVRLFGMTGDGVNDAPHLRFGSVQV